MEEIKLNNLESIDIGDTVPEISLDANLNSAEFGGGIELLMNDNKSSSKRANRLKV